MKLKRLSDKTVSKVNVIPPITQEEINQTNFGANPFCKWYGKEQFKYKKLKGNPLCTSLADK